MRSRLLVLFLLGSLAVALAAQTPTSVSATGYVTDTLCGQKGANAQHIDCAKRSVASGKAKYALYDEATKKLYLLEPQDTAVAYLGQRVKITGTLSTTPTSGEGSGTITRAGQMLVPAAVAGTALDKVVTLNKALDVSTSVPSNYVIACS